MFKRFMDDMKKYWKYAVYSSRAQLKSEIANSYLNWLWWILDPLCFMLIYVFMFGYVFKSNEQYFAVFVFIGITMWDFFNRCLMQSVKVIKNNKPIVSKVYIPKFILLIIKMCVNGFKMFISLAIVAAMLVVWQVPITWNILYYPNPADIICTGIRFRLFSSALRSICGRSRKRTEHCPETYFLPYRCVLEHYGSSSCSVQCLYRKRKSHCLSSHINERMRYLWTDSAP